MTLIVVPMHIKKYMDLNFKAYNIEKLLKYLIHCIPIIQ